MTRTVKVSNLSSKATERDIHDFFSFSGEIEHIELQSDGDGLKVAFVTFKDPHAVETAVLLSGATIGDHFISILEVEDSDPPPRASDMTQFLPTGAGNGIGGALYRAQDMMTSMLAKGYVLTKDAMNTAESLDEKHQISANATATVSSLDKKIGFTQAISSGTAAVNEHMKALDQRYQVSEKTRSAFVAAEQKVLSAGSTLLKNKYVLNSTAWVTGAFNKVAKAAEEVGQKTMEKVHMSL